MQIIYKENLISCPTSDGFLSNDLISAYFLYQLQVIDSIGEHESEHQFNFKVKVRVIHLGGLLLITTLNRYQVDSTTVISFCVLLKETSVWY